MDGIKVGSLDSEESFNSARVSLNFRAEKVQLLNFGDCGW